MKKQWSKPELAKVIRSRPEETVLDACKYALPDYAGALQNVSTCRLYIPCGPPCETQSAS